MEPPAFRIISIGTLAANPLWHENAEVRTGHATTTLISAGETHVLVDPSLPALALAARLSERTPVRHEQITHVFITCFTPDHYRGLAQFKNATWLIHEPEKQAATAAMEEQLDRAREIDDDDLVRNVEAHAELLARCEIAPDTIIPSVDLFPLPGVSPGSCGLLLALPATTVLICGDAVATSEHVDEGKVLPYCVDIELAQESFREAIEIADILIPGRDNIVHNPVRRMV